jgi:hypothetical protein
VVEKIKPAESGTKVGKLGMGEKFKVVLGPKLRGFYLRTFVEFITLSSIFYKQD